jgi:hypothetical protein
VFVLLLFVLANRFIGEALGFSLLGYPIFRLMEIFSGMHLA